MTISFTLPASVETVLGEDGWNPHVAAKEAALVELYRLGKLTHFQLSDALGLSRFETDGVLKRHHVTEDLLTMDELDEQVRSMKTVLPPP